MRGLSRGTLRVATAFLALWGSLAAFDGPAYAQVTMTDITLVSGLNWTIDQPKLRTGAGIVVLDWDGDGWSDLLLGGGNSEPPTIFRNLATGAVAFEKIDAAETGLAYWGDGFRAMAAADVDNDGDTDVFICNWATDSPSIFLRNDGGYFVDATAESGLNVAEIASLGAWGDFDNDGFLDLHVSRYYSKQNQLFRNNGDGTFKDITEGSGLDDPALYLPKFTPTTQSFQGLWYDWDRDGDMDLYELNDRCYAGWPRNYLYINNGDGTFTEDAASFGLDICLDSMGASLNDFDRDGHIDIVIANIYYGHFLMKGSCGGWSDVAFDMGVTATQWAWSTSFDDYDNDGWADITFAHEDLGTEDATNRVYVNQGGTSFVETSATTWGPDATPQPSFTHISGDFDRDGDLDIIVGNIGDGASYEVWRNDSPVRDWLQVALIGQQSNRDGVGAKVAVFANGVWSRQLRYESSAFGSRKEPIVHFGLGDDSAPVMVRIDWPSGARQLMEDVIPNQRITALEPKDVDAGAALIPIDGERCGDGVDNDCDGDTDEGFDVGAPCSGTVGICDLAGSMACDPDGLGTHCEITATPDGNAELCGDGLDNDCDGETDEGFPVGWPCVAENGACISEGVLACIPGTVNVVCQPLVFVGGDELCGDGIDNDCDGDTDEPDDSGDSGAVCMVGVGACMGLGTVLCAEGVASCDAVAGPKNDELCNGLDDDCDGVSDEAFDLGAACSVGVGPCIAEGVVVCSDTGGTECSAIAGDGGDETCNGVDDDCDGETDEGLGLGDVCSVGVGACVHSGAMVCGAFGAAVCDAVADGPTVEACGDALDNDCDGETDEGFDVGAACNLGTGACATQGVLICTADAFGTACWTAQPMVPNDESCGNSVDDDCDGETDEGFEDVGTACSIGVGACALIGAQVCGDDGLSVVCDARAGTPEIEIGANQIDDDCDGLTDEPSGIFIDEPGCAGGRSGTGGVLALAFGWLMAVAMRGRRRRTRPIPA